MSGQMESVRHFYGVPARRGATVTFTGYEEPVRGRIISSTGSHLYLRRDDDGRRFGPLHPTWEMDYGDGRDYTAETNARIAEFNRQVNAGLAVERRNGASE
jgi:hypothetical protein